MWIELENGNPLNLDLARTIYVEPSFMRQNGISVPYRYALKASMPAANTSIEIKSYKTRDEAKKALEVLKRELKVYSLN